MTSPDSAGTTPDSSRTFPGRFPLAGLILALDPGRMKTGYALVNRQGQPIRLGVVETTSVVELLQPMLRDNPVEQLVIGHATGMEDLEVVLTAHFGQVPCAIVGEAQSTLEARRLYWEDHPRRGWRRLVPLSLQVPPEPLDAYAALIIARRFLMQP